MNNNHKKLYQIYKCIDCNYISFSNHYKQSKLCLKNNCRYDAYILIYIYLDLSTIIAIENCIADSIYINNNHIISDNIITPTTTNDKLLLGNNQSDNQSNNQSEINQ